MASSDQPRDGERCPCDAEDDCCRVKHPGVLALWNHPDCCKCCGGKKKCLHPWHSRTKEKNYDCPIHGLQDGPECARC